jgi:hypothetical protein
MPMTLRLSQGGEGGAVVEIGDRGSMTGGAQLFGELAEPGTSIREAGTRA